MEKILAIVIVIFAIIGCFAIESAIVMWLWNSVIVALFGLKPISFWLGCGIMLVINFAIGLFRS